MVFECEFCAELANPVPGSVLSCFVRESNEFGVLVESGVRDAQNNLVPAMEIVIVKELALNKSQIDIAALSAGQEVQVELLQASFDVQDTRIMGIGRVLSSGPVDTVVEAEAGPGPAAGGAADDGGDSDSLSDVGSDIVGTDGGDPRSSDDEDEYEGGEDEVDGFDDEEDDGYDDGSEGAPDAS